MNDGERMNDTEAYDFYADPQHRRLLGSPRRRSTSPQLTEHVPVRFTADAIARVKSLAEQDGMTVSAWIRKQVEEAVDERVPMPSETAATFFAALKEGIARAHVETGEVGTTTSPNQSGLLTA
jgi:hypothetical protein